MSGRMTAARRLEVGLQAINLAYDRDGITVAAAAEELSVAQGIVADAVRPFTDLEYVHTSGTLLGDIGHVVTMVDGFILVQQNWVHDLTSVDPGEAALLLAMIETADDIEGIDISALKGLRRRLDAISNMSVQEPVTPSVSELVAAKHAGTVISARYEGSDMRVAGGPMLFEVHEVRWTPHGWQALVTLYGESGTNAFEVQPELLHDIEQTDHRFERRSLTMPEYVAGAKLVDVVLEFPIKEKWLLGYFGLEALSEDGEMATGQIHIDPGRALGRLLLRLGPRARVLSPEWLEHAPHEAAVRILDLYRDNE